MMGIADYIQGMLRRFYNLAAAQLSGENRRTSRILLFVIWALGLGLLIWLIWDHWDEILPYLLDADVTPLFYSFISFLISIITATIGWTLIMRPFSPHVPWVTHARIYAITLIVRRLPGTLWYVGGRLMLYGNIGVPKTFVAFASGLEIAVIVVSGFFLSLIALPDLPSVSWLIFILVGSAALLIGIAPRLVRTITERRGLELQGSLGWKVVAGWMAAYLATWLLGGIMLVYIVKAFFALPPDQIAFVLGAWSFSGVMGTLTIFLPSTFGVGEISLSIFLGQIMPLPLAIVIALLTRLLTYLYDFVIAAAIYPFIRNKK